MPPEPPTHFLRCSAFGRPACSRYRPAEDVQGKGRSGVFCLRVALLSSGQTKNGEAGAWVFQQLLMISSDKRRPRLRFVCKLIRPVPGRRRVAKLASRRSIPLRRNSAGSARERMPANSPIGILCASESEFPSCSAPPSTRGVQLPKPSKRSPPRRGRIFDGLPRAAADDISSASRMRTMHANGLAFARRLQFKVSPGQSAPVIFKHGP